MSLFSAPVAERVQRERRTELETVNMHLEAVYRIRDFNKAQNVARTKMAAAKAATGITAGALAGSDVYADWKVAVAKGSEAQNKNDAEASRKAVDARKAADEEKAWRDKNSKTQTLSATAGTPADTGKGRSTAAGEEGIICHSRRSAPIWLGPMLAAESGGNWAQTLGRLGP